MSPGFAGTHPAEFMQLVNEVVVRRDDANDPNVRWLIARCRQRNIASIRYDVATDAVDSLVSQVDEVRVGGAGALSNLASMLRTDAISGQHFYYDETGEHHGVFEVSKVDMEAARLPSKLERDLALGGHENHNVTLLQVLPRTDKFVGIGDVRHQAGGSDLTKVRIEEGASILPLSVQQGSGVLHEASIRVVTTTFVDEVNRAPERTGQVVAAELDRADCINSKTAQCL